MTDGSSTERTVDEINEAVEHALTRLSEGELAAISYLTGIPVDKLIELGGVHEAAETQTRGDRQAVPGPVLDLPPGDIP